MNDSGEGSGNGGQDYNIKHQHDFEKAKSKLISDARYLLKFATRGPIPVYSVDFFAGKSF